MSKSLAGAFKKSDLDILVEFESPTDFFDYLGLEEYLTNLLGIKVDLVMKKALKPNIGKKILIIKFPGAK